MRAPVPPAPKWTFAAASRGGLWSDGLDACFTSDSGRCRWRGDGWGNSGFAPWTVQLAFYPWMTATAAKL